MRSPKYPLEPLAQLRDRRASAALRAQAAAVRQREGAETARGTVEDRRREHERSVAQVGDAERTALEGGDLRAADLARAASWGARMTTERQGLSAAVARAREDEEKARDAEREAQVIVAARDADVQVVAKDRMRWEDAQREEKECREEEALSEAWRPRR